jgi:hypothetical protein
LVSFLIVFLLESFEMFSDKDGLLALSEKQRSRLKDWMRPDEFCSEPVLISKVFLLFRFNNSNILFRSTLAP